MGNPRSVEGGLDKISKCSSGRKFDSVVVGTLSLQKI